jgi:predicted phosphate transport protein (TIGR00153 family)
VRLIPKDEGFFELFDQLSEKLTKSARVLDQLFAEPGRLDFFSTQIKLIEREADDIVREVMNRLDRTFVTPLDREDIHMLASSLDTVVDLMDGTARRALMFNVTEGKAPASALAGLLVQAADVIAEAVKHIKKPKDVMDAARAIKLLEEEGDGIYSDAVGALFRQSGVDPLEVLKWKEIYDNLEHALDEAEDVMNVLESIALKNS